MVVFAGQGDARRSMALLWQQEPENSLRPGPKQGLDVETIVRAAVEIADTDGIGALSMRAVGEKLGRTAMALYTYVPSKSELVDLMYDRTLAEQPTEYDLGPGWRAALTLRANDTWDFYLRHPWVLQVSQARPALGPNEWATLETTLRIMVATGLPPRSVRQLTGALYQFIRGVAQTLAEATYAVRATGMSDEEWLSARSGMLAEVAPDFAERYPTMAALSAADSSGPADATVPYLQKSTTETFRAGLAVFLDGIEQAIAQPS
ncbi:TetR/AcrR family transcriptional regulator [Actinocrispum sp. NPDC049592]|uniref:TetR/AcrR family transcriptional regulator n=1 Tax=Actinocrispum sp. NPDC049592 TaxID=3154835 RepID=UPI003427843E